LIANVLSFFFFPLSNSPSSERMPTQKNDAQALKDTGRATVRMVRLDIAPRLLHGRLIFPHGFSHRRTFR